MQQATINLPSSHPVRAMTGLARQIALPSEFAPERFPSFPALERTAVMGFNQPTTMNVLSTGSRLMVTRQASFPLWADRAVNGWTYSATWPTQSPSGSSTAEQLTIIDTLSNWAKGDIVASGRYPGVSGSDPYTNSYIPLALDMTTGDRPFIYLPSGANLYFVVATSVALAAVTLNLTYETWSAPGEVASTTLVAVTAGATTGVMYAAVNTALPGIWVRPSFLSASTAASAALVGWTVTAVVVCGGTATYTTSGGANLGTVNVVKVANVSHLPAVEPVEFANSQLPWFSTRLTAVACLATNVSQVLNKAGTVLAGRVSPATLSPFSATASYINSLHPAEKSWLPLETGFYTYCPPSTDLAEFWDYTLNTAGESLWGAAPAGPVYRLDNASLVNVAYFTAGSVAETMALSASWHLEFRTSSALFQIALSGMQLEILHQAQLALASAGFFFENPTHSAILKKVIQAVHAVAPAAISLVRYAHPVAGKLMQVGYSALTNPGKKKKGKKAVTQPNQGSRKINVPQAKMVVRPTSGQNSGIVTKKKGGLQMYLDSRQKR